jgi:hypothetical protein
MHQLVSHPDGSHKMQPIARHSRIYTFCAIALFFALSCAWCIQFFPFTDLRSHVMTDGDPALNAWALNWVSHAIVNDPSNILNGNTFYPHPGAIKLSEHMFSLALINVVVQFFSDGPWVGYNILIFLAYFLSAVGAYYFIYHVTQNRLAAFWGGVFWGFCFFRVHHTSHLQILSYQWLAFIALFIVKTRKTPNLTNASLLALFFVLQALTSWYLAIIALAFSVVIFLANANWANWGKEQSLWFGWAGLVAALPILPFVLAYSGTLHDTSLGERAMHLGALADQVKPLDFLIPPNATYIGSLIPNNKYWIWQENTLFIGYTATLLACIGLITAWRQNWRMALTGLLLIITGYIFALGFFSNAFGIKLPLYFLAQKISFFSAIRAPQRFALLIYFGVMILSCYGLITISQKLHQKTRIAILAAVVCVFILEVYPAKLPFTAMPKYAPSNIDRALAKISKEEDRQFKILHFPIHTAKAGYPTQEATYMVDSTLHWNPIANGFSGAEPIGFKAEIRLLNELPNEDAVALIKKYEINVIALHAGIDPSHRARIIDFFKTSGTAEIKSISTTEQLIFLRP